ncbi:MAG: DNA repair protein RecO [Gammaproteobacteria bacterium]|nr:DNA repair protein RecO [Gammaproteobacteria bacterium]MDH3768377.1 DNA repair protein RecO [Gammaproteobacteria bacterium]
MQRQRIVLQPAFLLHQSPYRDTSSLLELISRDHGRVGLIARGARRPKASLRAVLQPFQPLLVSWISRGDLGTLTGAEIVPSAITLPPPSVYSGYYMNELLVRLTRRHDAHPRLFTQYADALEGLGDEHSDTRVLRLFEKNLLEELGYGLDLTQTVTGTAVSEDDTLYEYKLEHGVIHAESGCSEAMVFSGRSLLSLADERLDDETAIQDARRLLRAVLELYLGSRPLEVRRVARAMRRALR